MLRYSSYLWKKLLHTVCFYTHSLVSPRRKDVHCWEMEIPSHGALPHLSHLPYPLLSGPKILLFFFFLPSHTFFTNTEKVQTETVCCRSPKDSHRSSTEPQTFPIHRIWALFSPIYRVTQLQKSQPLRAPLHSTAPQGAGIAPSLQIPAPQQPAPDSSQELKPFPHVPIPWNTSLLRSSHDQSQEPKSSEALLLPASFKVTLIVWALSFPLPKICCAQTA